MVSKPDLTSQSNNHVSSDTNVRQARQRSSSYPRYNLRQVEELAKVVFDQGPHHCDQDRVAQEVGYKSANSGSFKGLKAAANQFGLIELKADGYLSVSVNWIEVFHHSDSPELLKQERKKAMLQPTLYKQVIEEYRGRQLPTPEKLIRELYLNQKYGILKEAADGAARIFLESASYAGIVNDRGYLVDNDQDEQIRVQEDQEERRLEKQQPSTPKKTLSDQDSAPHNAPESDTPSTLQGLEKHEIMLVNRQKAYLYVPVPLPHGERERLKKYVDLILEETSPSKQSYLEGLNNDPWNTTV